MSLAGRFLPHASSIRSLKLLDRCSAARDPDRTVAESTAHRLFTKWSSHPIRPLPAYRMPKPERNYMQRPLASVRHSWFNREFSTGFRRKLISWPLQNLVIEFGIAIFRVRLPTYFTSA